MLWSTYDLADGQRSPAGGDGWTSGEQGRPVGRPLPARSRRPAAGAQRRLSCEAGHVTGVLSGSPAAASIFRRARHSTGPPIDPGYMSRKIQKFRTDKFDT